MPGQPEVVAIVPDPHRTARRVSVVTVAAAVVLGMLAVLVTAIPACSCAEPTDLVVMNYSSEITTVTWTAPGVLGTPFLGLSGRTTVAACTSWSTALRPGAVEITIDAASTTHTFGIEVRTTIAERAGHQTTVLLDRNGRVGDPIDGAPPGGYPWGPLC
jgi:hypothetical protein